jgi:hypothetical protein
MISGAILLILLGNGIAIFAYCLLAFNVATITIPAIAFNSLRLEKIESIKNNGGSVNIEFTDDEVIVKTSDASGNFKKKLINEMRQAKSFYIAMRKNTIVLSIPKGINNELIESTFNNIMSNKKIR